MRIAVVHSFYTAAQPSGENAVVRDQVALLEQAGHEVLLVAEHTDERSGEPAYALRSAGRVATGLGRNPADRLGRFRPDLVHAHNTFPNFGTRWVRTWGPRTVVTLHNFRSVCSNGLLFRDGHPCTDCLATPVLPAVRHGCYRGSPAATLPLALASAPGGSLRRLPREAARVVALNAEAARLLSRVLARRVDVVPNFVSAGSPGNGSVARWAYVGRLGEEKGIAELMREWPLGHRLDVIGDGPLREVVQARSERDPAVRFSGLGPVNVCWPGSATTAVSCCPACAPRGCRRSCSKPWPGRSRWWCPATSTRPRAWSRRVWRRRTPPAPGKANSRRRSQSSRRPRAWGRPLGDCTPSAIRRRRGWSR